MVQKNISDEVENFFNEYDPKWQTLYDTTQTALANITDIPDSYWPQLAKFLNTLAEKDYPAENTTDFLSNILGTLFSAMQNSLFTTFDIDLAQEFFDQDQNKNVSIDVAGGGFENNVNYDTWDRYQLVVSPIPAVPIFCNCDMRLLFYGINTDDV